MRRPSLTLLAWSATLHACPQLRDADFRALPGEVRSRPDAGGGAGGSDTIGGAGGNGHVTEPPRDASAPGASVETLRAAIAHRYTFDGTGSIAVDSIGDSDATLIGATLDGGHLTLDGNGPYVDLPNGVVSAANEQTIEAWLTWNGGNAWQRMSSGPKRRSEHRPTWQRRRIKSGDRGREVDTPRSPPFFV